MGISTNQQRIYFFCRVSKIGNGFSTVELLTHCKPMKRAVCLLLIKHMFSTLNRFYGYVEGLGVYT